MFRGPAGVAVPTVRPRLSVPSVHPPVFEPSYVRVATAQWWVTSPVLGERRNISVLFTVSNVTSTISVGISSDMAHSLHVSLDHMRRVKIS